MRRLASWHGLYRLVLALLVVLVLPSVAAPSVRTGGASQPRDVVHTAYDTEAAALARSPGRPHAEPARPRTVDHAAPDATTFARAPHDLADLGLAPVDHASATRTTSPPATRERAPPTH